VKLFLVAPPQEVIRKKDKFAAYLRDVKRQVDMDSTSMVAIVGPDATDNEDGVIGITRGSKVTEKFQYRLTSAYDHGVERAFGVTAYVDKYGYDQATLVTFENLAACLLLASEDSSNRECGMFPLNKDRVREVLESRGVFVGSM